MKDSNTLLSDSKLSEYRYSGTSLLQSSMILGKNYHLGLSNSDHINSQVTANRRVTNVLNQLNHIYR